MPQQSIMSSWYARNSLMPSQRTVQSNNSFGSNTVPCMKLRDRRSAPSVQHLPTRTKPNTQHANTLGSGINGYNRLNKTISFRNDMDIPNTHAPLVDKKASNARNELSQVSELTMTQELSNIRKSQASTYPDCSICHQHEGILGQETRSTSTNISSVEMSQHTSTSKSPSIYSVPSQSSRESYSAVSSIFHKNAALRWRPGNLQSQRLTNVNNLKPYLSNPVLSRTLEKERTRTSTVDDGGHMQHFPSHYSASHNGNVHNHRNSFPIFSVQEKVADNNSLHSISIPLRQRMISSQSVAPSEAIQREYSQMRAADLQPRNTAKTILRRNVSPNQSCEILHWNETKEGARNLGELGVDGSEIQGRLESYILEIGIKEREMLVNFEEFEKKQHAFHIRMVASEEDNVQRMKQLSDEFQQKLKAIDLATAETLAQQKEKEDQVKALSNDIKRKIMDANEKYESQISDLKQKLLSFDCSVNKADEKHRRNMIELSSKESKVKRTFFKVSELLKNAEQTASRVSSLAESTLMSINKARTSFVESALPLLTSPITQIVNSLLGDVTSFLGKSTLSPQIVEENVLDKIALCDVAAELEQTPYCYTDRTPPRPNKQAPEQMSAEPCHPPPKRRGRPRKITQVDKPANISMKQPAKIASISPLGSDKYLCVTPCEKENSMRRDTSRCVGTYKRKAAFFKDEKQRRPKSNKGKFGNSHERIDLQDEEFSFL